MLAKGPPRFRSDGSFAGYISSCVDITERKNTEDELVKSEFQFRSLVETAPFPIGVYVGREMRISIANSSMLSVWGKGDDVIGKLYSDILSELANQEVFNQLDKVYTTGLPYHSQNQRIDILHAGKLRPFYFNYSFTPLFDAAGKVYAVMNTAADVTDLNLAKEKVEESEKEFRQLADTLPEMVWTTDAKGQQIFASAKWKEYTGLDPYDAATFEKMVHPDEFDNLIRIWTSCLQTGELYKSNVRLKMANGEYHWFYINGEPVRNDQGEIEKWIGTFSNINELKLAEQQIIEVLEHVKENEARLNLVIDASELGTWELDFVTDELTHSERMVDIFGFKSGSKIDHQSFKDLLLPEDMSVRDRAFKEAIETGILHYEARHIWPDSSMHWVEAKGHVFYDENEKPIKFVGTVRDITEEKNFQLILQENEQRFRLLADSMPQLVWTSNAAGNINYFNQSVYKYSGLTPDRALNGGWIDIVHPDEREENTRAWLKSVSTGKDFIFEHRFRRHDGEYRWQLSRAIPQRDSVGNIEMWVGTSTDIQDIKELDQQKDYFISMASHELKTPITSIKGYVQILQKMYHQTGDELLNKSLKVIDRQVITLTSLISDLLDLSKIKNGNLILNKEEFTVNELVEEVIQEIKHINPDYEIIFSRSKNASINADRERIGQVLVNFLTNAVKYSPTNKTIEVSSALKENEITITVKDYGIGISRHSQQKIFERFYRVEGNSEQTFPGFGIGLFIAADIVKRHRGHIGVRSEIGKGSSFFFTLPV